VGRRHSTFQNAKPFSPRYGKRAKLTVLIHCGQALACSGGVEAAMLNHPNRMSNPAPVDLMLSPVVGCGNRF